jgi:hypothetical protein
MNLKGKQNKQLNEIRDSAGYERDSIKMEIYT